MLARLPTLCIAHIVWHGGAPVFCALRATCRATRAKCSPQHLASDVYARVWRGYAPYALVLDVTLETRPPHPMRIGMCGHVVADDDGGECPRVHTSTHWATLMRARRYMLALQRHYAALHTAGSLSVGDLQSMMFTVFIGRFPRPMHTDATATCYHLNRYLSGCTVADSETTATDVVHAMLAADGETQRPECEMRAYTEYSVYSGPSGVVYACWDLPFGATLLSRTGLPHRTERDVAHLRHADLDDPM